MSSNKVQLGTRPVPATVKHVQRGRLLAATALAPVEEDGVAAGDFRLKVRPNGMLAVFDGGVYVVSTRTRDPEKAQDFLDIFAAQAEAKRMGELDVRFADATAVIDAFLKVKGRSREAQTTLKNALDRLRPFVAGKRVRQLDDDWLDRTWDALKTAPQKPRPFAKTPPKKGYAAASIWLSFTQMSVAILSWCRRHKAMPFLPFERPGTVKGRDIVFSRDDKRIIERWSRGSEDYDPKTRRWTPAARPLDGREIHERRMIDRMWVTSTGTASRPGNVWGLALEESLDCPYLLPEEETLYRVPLGERTPDNKLAPPVRLSPAVMAEVRRFLKEDGPDEVYLLRTWERTGRPTRPLSQASCSKRWKKAMLKLGIRGRRHACRHTTVTYMVRRNVPAIVISATAGMSLRTIKERYNHNADRDVQPIGHTAIDALMAKGIGIASPRRAA